MYKKNHDLSQLYVQCGQKCYICGSQDGGFPSFGRHFKNEMGGIWMLPYKALDAFYLTINGEFIGNAYEIEVAQTETNFYYKFNNLEIIRKEWCALDTKQICVEFFIKNLGEAQTLDINFVVVFKNIPGWLYKEKGLEKGKQILEIKENTLLNSNISNNFFVTVAEGENSTYSLGKNYCFIESINEYTAGEIKNLVSVDKEQNILLRYFIAGSEISANDAIDLNFSLQRDYENLKKKKETYYHKVIENNKITTPDKKINELFDMIKNNNEWLKTDVKDIGKYMVAGLPDYTALFGCDSTYSIQGLLAIGEKDICKSILEILINKSFDTNKNGRILHELAPINFVPNVGNTQETAHFISAFGSYIEWTNDLDFLKKYFPLLQKSLDWLVNTMATDNDFFPYGYGIMEIKGLNTKLIDSATYTVMSLKYMSTFAELLGEKELAISYKEQFNLSLKNLNEKFWIDELDSYGDCVTNAEKLINSFVHYNEQINEKANESNHHNLAKFLKIKNNLENFKNKKQERAWLIFDNWVVLCPFECGFAPTERAEKFLKKFLNTSRLNNYGIKIDLASPWSITMTISTGVCGVALGKYGYMDEALKVFQSLSNNMSLEMPGSVSELSPISGCIVQEWTTYGLMKWLVCQVIGLNPDFKNNKIIIKPHLPSEWNEISYENINMFGSIFDIKIERLGERYNITHNYKGNFEIEIL